VPSPQPAELLVLSLRPSAVWELEAPERNDWGERWTRFGSELCGKLTAAMDAGGQKQKARIDMGRREYIDLEAMELVKEPNKVHGTLRTCRSLLSFSFFSFFSS
jgi:hypothetical protein